MARMLDVPNRGVHALALGLPSRPDPRKNSP